MLESACLHECSLERSKRQTEDIEQIVVKTNEKGTPVTIGDIGNVSLGPEIRRGIANLDGKGDVVGGVELLVYPAVYMLWRERSLPWGDTGRRS